MNSRRKFLGFLGIGSLAIANQVMATETKPNTITPTSKYLGKIQGFKIYYGVYPAYSPKQTVIEVFGEHGSTAEFAGASIDIELNHVDLTKICLAFDKLYSTPVDKRCHQRCDITINNIPFKVRCWVGQWQKNKTYDEITQTFQDTK